MTAITHSDAERDEAKAATIIAAFRAEWPTLIGANGNKVHGCEMRHRNKLVRKAGYSYQEAYDAVHKAKKELTRP